MLETLAGADDSAARFATLDARILSFLGGRPNRSFEGSATAMRAVMGGNQNEISQRLHALRDKGAIRKDGGYHDPIYSVP